ncbi:uncharacterized protein LOC130715578 [Lotus japonicus]|uniref:uncharacterized protein LOC130715578 n=1 Tax=Lotus japonicus TaxID=34305 RepID=UPI002585B171|nr:uncharacterized protein LOC130715578 [Lotus japonicus]XP_057421677.1 uncharacterized protein LOC130715578 [Lotus japonicus]
MTTTDASAFDSCCYHHKNENDGDYGLHTTATKVKQLFESLCKELDMQYPTEEERHKRFGIKAWAEIPKPTPFVGGAADCFRKLPKEILESEFQRWCDAYSVSYPSEPEKLYRSRVFKENFALMGSMACTQYILHHFRGFGVGSYADRTFDEMKRLEEEKATGYGSFLCFIWNKLIYIFSGRGL